MKRLLLIITMAITAFSAEAQEGKWTVKMNGKTLVSTSTEDEKINTKKITAAEWKKSGSLEVNFQEADNNGFWIRSFQFEDDKGNQLFNADSTNKLKISLSKLRQLFAGKKKIIIYTVVRPSNPDIMVRVRRIHLYTLMLP